jgi:hypothetical protein
MKAFRKAYKIASKSGGWHDIEEARDAGVLELYLDIRQRMSAKVIRRKTREHNMRKFPGAEQ